MRKAATSTASPGSSTNHRDLIDAAFCLNEGGGGQAKNGRYLLNEVQASEKVYQSFRLEVKNAGGHSSLPRAENRDLSTRRGTDAPREVRLPGHAQRSDAHLFRPHVAARVGQLAADMRAVSFADTEPRGGLTALCGRRTTTPCFARPAWPRNSWAVTPRTRCLRWPAPSSIAACCPGRTPKRCRRLWFGCWAIPISR